MKIKVLYEENIKNGHKNYTTIEIPDGDYSIMLDIDYEQRLAEAKPETKEKPYPVAIVETDETGIIVEVPQKERHHRRKNR